MGLIKGGTIINLYVQVAESKDAHILIAAHRQ